MKTATWVLVSVLATTLTVVALGGPQPLLQPDTTKARLAERAKAERQAAALTTLTNAVAKASDLAAVKVAIANWASAEKVEKEIEAKPVSAGVVEALSGEGKGAPKR
jgi:hypothetical protein